MDQTTLYGFYSEAKKIIYISTMLDFAEKSERITARLIMIKFECAKALIFALINISNQQIIRLLDKGELFAKSLQLLADYTLGIFEDYSKNYNLASRDIESKK